MDDDLLDLLASWRRDLRAASKDDETILVYQRAVRQFAAWLEEHGHTPTLANLTRPMIAQWLADMADRRAAGTVLIRHKGLHRFCKWLLGEGDIPADPMAGLAQPRPQPKPVPVLTDATVTALLNTCTGPSFTDRRDHACLRVLFDCGLRISELAGLAVDDVDLDAGERRHRGLDVLYVRGKGGKDRNVPFGVKTARALDRYLRARRQHPHADLPGLWLGTRGRLGSDGVEYLLGKRAAQAGVEGLHAHRFRHTFAHRWLADGGQERDLMRLAGWSSEAMLSRYGASAADERAQEAFRRMRLGDRL